MSKWTTLRREVLLDKAQTLAKLSRGQFAPPLPSRGSFEAGGSGGDFTDDDGVQNGDSNEELENLAHGIDYGLAVDPGDYDSDQEIDYDKASVRFEHMDDFLRFLVHPLARSLRVLPNNPTLPEIDSDDGTATDLTNAEQKRSIHVYKSGARPFLHRGNTYTYPGGAKDLSAYLPVSGTTDILVMLDPASIPGSYDTTGAALHIETSGSVVSDPDLWPRSYFPLAVVTLDEEWTDSASEGITEQSIQDVRPIFSWGVVPTVRTPVVFAEDGSHTFFADDRDSVGTASNYTFTLPETPDKLVMVASGPYTLRPNDYTLTGASLFIKANRNARPVQGEDVLVVYTA